VRGDDHPRVKISVQLSVPAGVCRLYDGSGRTIWSGSVFRSCSDVEQQYWRPIVTLGYILGWGFGGQTSKAVLHRWLVLVFCIQILSGGCGSCACDPKWNSHSSWFCVVLLFWVANSAGGLSSYLNMHLCRGIMPLPGNSILLVVQNGVLQQGDCWHVFFLKYRFLYNRMNAGRVCALFWLASLGTMFKEGCLCWWVVVGLEAFRMLNLYCPQRWDLDLFENCCVFWPLEAIFRSCVYSFSKQLWFSVDFV